MRIATITAFALLIGNAAEADVATYQLDPEHTAVYFTVDHVGYAKTLGIFTKLAGTFTYDDESHKLDDIDVSIDAASIASFNKARDKHVRSKDFLNVKAHPAITFTATGIDVADAANGTTVTGDLTILGKTQAITLNVTLNKAARYPFGHKRDVLGLSMNTDINRSEFGMTYAVDNGLVGDKVTIRIETEAMKIK